MNPTFLEKADMVLNDLTTGGLLTVEQSDRFIQDLVDQPTILNVARVVPMSGPTMELNAIGFGSRLLRPAVENTALSQSDRVKPTTRNIPLASKEFIAEIRIPYGVLEDNIERGTLEQTLLGMLAKGVARDIEELIIRGDTASGDAYLAKVNGLVKRITNNVVDATGTGITPATWNNALLALADVYKTDINALRFFTTSAIEQNYRLAVSNRQTALGDATLQGAEQARVLGVPIIRASLMPAGTAILSDPFNFIVGIQRQIRIESDKDITTRQKIYVVTLRMDVTIENQNAAVKVINMA